ncbi:esterase-like activity of phytase family protein [Paracoccus suum]|uniref:esterase-like activity of phytase family protein n=1 Tax=Paracoccus suum TaxID=2259340 RepID=UPI001F545F2E|nr:esterase-like activity of phytase family protein [Paracoccus suum]
MAAGADPASAARVTYVGTYVWQSDEPTFGGFSGLEVSDDGSRYWALSDRATIRWGSFERDRAGRIRGMTTAGTAALRSTKGAPLKPGYEGDSEGLAIAPDGTIWVSFEGLNRVVSYATPDSSAQAIPLPPAFTDLPDNGGLEALAVLPEGTLLTVPERSGGTDKPYQFYRFRDGAWDQPFTMPRSDSWLPVGADVGSDGRLYLLERNFRGIMGFASRVRRFDIAEDGLSGGEVLLTTSPGQYDNLEGLAVWRNDRGIHLTMISDDNFLIFQRTELVEYRVTD